MMASLLLKHHNIILLKPPFLSVICFIAWLDDMVSVCGTVLHDTVSHTVLDQSDR